jgi:predicted glycosyltransferase
VPRPGPSAEQRMRAGFLSQRGCLTAIDPCELSATTMAAAIIDSLNKPAPSAFMPEMNGVETVTRKLLTWLDAGPQSARPWPDRKSSPARVSLAALP